MYIKRHLETTIEKLSSCFKVLLVTGPRQVGKTTLLRKLADSGRTYVTMDDINVRSLAMTEPALFLQRYKPPLLIDEIQMAPKLLPYIKMYVDEQGRNGDFWLTGSQAFELMNGVSESLAGRIAVVNLLGLSYGELLARPAATFVSETEFLLKRAQDSLLLPMSDLFERIWQGSMPALNNASEQDWNCYYSSYVQTFLQRDVKELAQVNDELQFYRFLCAAASYTGSMLNYAALAKEVEITPPTAKQWLKVLAAAGLVYFLEPLAHPNLKYAVKAPKLYFTDTGLAAYLLRWSSAATLEAGAMASNFFETWVVNEIYKSFINCGQVPPLSYFRDFNTKEIELLIETDGCVYPLAIRKSAQPAREIKKFEILKPVTKGERPMIIGNGGVICLASDLLPVDAKNWYIPVGLL
ncbi:ATP-binding protein [uncultured Phascolarctobacterium sp.]|uniref:ATP-binding protein n=1 Tax=uncultured Phascolarctobacterium sp. TaxID=512296 RepID=UPI0025D140AE|nr:ATP-binding protein [uncultured Phascolarctobacterium sp.]